MAGRKRTRPGQNIGRMNQPNVRYGTATPTAPSPPHRRAQIFQAAIDLFAAKGYHATSMQDIADALGIQRGSLYHHIESKEDLLFEIMWSGITRMIEPVEAVVSSRHRASEKLDRFIEAHFDTLTSLGSVRVLFRELRSLPPARRQKIVAQRDHYEGLLRTIIAEGVASGQFRAVDPKFAGLMVLGVCNWACLWYSPDGPMSRAEIARVFSNLLLRGLEAPPPAAPAGRPARAR